MVMSHEEGVIYPLYDHSILIFKSAIHLPHEVVYRPLSYNQDKGSGWNTETHSIIYRDRFEKKE